MGSHLGLFAGSRGIPPGLYITEYDGPRISREEAIERKRLGLASHLRRVGWDLVIDGITKYLMSLTITSLGHILVEVERAFPMIREIRHCIMLSSLNVNFIWVWYHVKDFLLSRVCS